MWWGAALTLLTQVLAAAALIADGRARPAAMVRPSPQWPAVLLAR